MRVRDINNKVENRHQQPKEKNTLRMVLSTMFNFIERFERSSRIESKNDREKIDILKNVISDMVKDEDQKKIIRGEG